MYTHCGEGVAVPKAGWQPEDGAADCIRPLQQLRLSALHLPIEDSPFQSQTIESSRLVC